jgi:hypothetical protein
MRKGMMKGSGKRGYHNIIGKDPMVHSQSAKGIKQPQKRMNILRKRKRRDNILIKYNEELMKAEIINGYKRLWSIQRSQWVYIDEDEQPDFHRVWGQESPESTRGWYFHLSDLYAEVGGNNA